jgi:hypothetical protein
MGDYIPTKHTIPSLFTRKMITRERHCSRLPLLIIKESMEKGPCCTRYPVTPVDVLRNSKTSLSDTMALAIGSPTSNALQEMDLLVDAQREEMVDLRVAHRSLFDEKYNALMSKKSVFWTKTVFNKREYNAINAQIRDLKASFKHQLRIDVMKLKRKQLWTRNMHNLRIGSVSHNLSIITSQLTQYIPTPIQLQVTNFNKRLNGVCRL